MAQKIAIVEDDKAICDMYRLKLESKGYTVKTASNGKLGLQLAEDMKPDLILLDLMMPEMTGDQMLAAMRKTEWGKDIKVIVLTNISEDEVPTKLLDLHVNRYIVKAYYTPQQVLDVVHEVLNNSSEPTSKSTSATTGN